MAVLRPLKITILNYPEDKTEELDAENNPEDTNSGSRKILFSREIYIEQEDFLENPPKKFFRLSPGMEVRLKHAYIIKCEDMIKDANGEIIELHCSYDPDTKSGSGTVLRKVKATLHWVSSINSIKTEVRLYEQLFLNENPEECENDFKDNLNPDSMKILSTCMVEESLSTAKPGDNFQFLRQGYFCVDSDSTKTTPVFNRTVSLRDTWAKIQKKS